MPRSTALIDEPSEITALDTLGSLLGRVGAELDDVAGRLGRLTIAGGSPGQDARLSSHEMTALQDIDLACQMLQSLATVMRRAALSDAATGAIDVERLAMELPLEAMTRIVTGRPDNPEAGGDLDLF